jgi:capsid protein
LRLYTAAVISAATRAAEFSGVMETDLPPDKVAADLADPLTVIESVRNSLVSLPEGWKMSQLKAEQPTTTYEMFKKQIITEAGRCVSMPLNVISGDSSDYNYASGRLDYQTYDRGIEVERADIRAAVLDRIYAAWLAEYRSVAGLSNAQIAELSDHDWHYSGRGHVDPGKEANADDTRLRNGTTTRARLYAKLGADWKREGAQWIKERIELERQWNEARKEAGLEPAPYPGNGEQYLQQAAPPMPEDEDDTEEPEDEPKKPEDDSTEVEPAQPAK